MAKLDSAQEPILLSNVHAFLGHDRRVHHSSIIDAPEDDAEPMLQEKHVRAFLGHEPSSKRLRRQQWCLPAVLGCTCIALITYWRPFAGAAASAPVRNERAHVEAVPRASRQDTYSTESPQSSVPPPTSSPPSPPPPPLPPCAINSPRPPTLSSFFDADAGRCSDENECTLEMRMSDVTVSTSAVSTTPFFNLFNRNSAQNDARFVCQVSSFSMSADHWITSFEPLIMPHSPTNQSFMHHTNVYLCTEEVTEWARMAADDDNACPSYSFLGARGGPCHRLAWAYDKTGGTFRTSQGAGMMLGPSLWLTRIMIVAHYLAPLEMPPRWKITDHSGVRMTLTRQPLVPSAIFGTGLDQILIPPSVEDHQQWVEVNADTMADVLGEHIDRNGGHVDVTAFHLHAHSSAVAIWVEHFRGGTRVADLASMRPYRGYSEDETFLPLEEPVAIRRGDWVRLHCVFNASHREAITFYGTANGDEMCMALFVFQPVAMPSDRSHLRIGWAVPSSRSALDPSLERAAESQNRASQWDGDRPLMQNLARTYRGELLIWRGFGETFLSSSRAAAMGWRRES